MLQRVENVGAALEQWSTRIPCSNTKIYFSVEQYVGARPDVMSNVGALMEHLTHFLMIRVLALDEPIGPLVGVVFVMGGLWIVSMVRSQKKM